MSAFIKSLILAVAVGLIAFKLAAMYAVSSTSIAEKVACEESTHGNKSFYVCLINTAI